MLSFRCGIDFRSRVLGFVAEVVQIQFIPKGRHSDTVHSGSFRV